MGSCSSKDTATAVMPATNGVARNGGQSDSRPQSEAESDVASSRRGRPTPRNSIIGTIDKSEHMVLVPMEIGEPIESVYDGVHDGPELGTGITGIVRKVTHKKTGHEYAVKKLDLGKIETEEDLQQLRQEIAIMCQLDHPNVVRLEEVYESPTAIYLVQELCLGGDLFDRLDAQDDVHYTEAGCARLMKQIVDAIRYIHDKGIIHRDLKLENFMFSSQEEDSRLRMIDFGLSKHFQYGDILNEAVGSAYTVAPEVILGEYNEKADLWSVGVITYLLLSGETPFGGAGEEDISPMQTRQNILAANYEFLPEYIWENISPQAVDFIKSLLVTDPTQRPTAEEIQKSEWLTTWADAEGSAEDRELNPDIVQALVSFKEKDDMLKLLSEVLSFTLLPDQLEGLRKQFEIMDSEGRGEISLGDLKNALVMNAEAGSLGSLSEEEIEDIFQAMRVRKTEMRIHWHEFIAAALSQVEIDDRNLELAFERLDTEHKGYIEVENIIELMGGYTDENEDSIRKMWQNVFKDRNVERCRRVSKKEFLLLMKGQRQPDRTAETKDEEPPLFLFSDSGRAVSLPEHSDGDNEIVRVVSESSATPLVVNRMLYRAHRQSRLAVLEASRLFEEEQMKRTAKKLNESLSNTEYSVGVNSSLYGAGLMMRHSEDATATSESVRKLVKQTQEEMQEKISKAARKSGRNYDRRRSHSDMTELLASIPITPKANGKSPSARNLGRKKMSSMELVPKIPEQPDEQIY